MMKKTISTIALALALVAAPPLVQSARAQDATFDNDKKAAKEDAKAEEAAKKGVRLMICSPSGETLPNPLYCKSGKKFIQVILAARTPSRPIPSQDGKILFWKSDPSSAVAGAKDDAEKEAKLPPADYVLNGVPSGSKMVGFVIPTKDSKTLQGLFFKEKDFPKQGVHLINLSPYPIRMTTSTKGDFSDAKNAVLSPYRKDDGINQKTSWSVSGNDGETLSFAVSYKANNMPDFKRFKVSSLVVSQRQSQITVVVKDPVHDSPKLLSFQIADVK